MPTTLEVLANGHIIRQIYVDPWGLPDLTKMFDESEKFYDESNHKVHLITDVTQVRTLPLGILRARHNPSLSHKNAGVIVVVGAALLLRRIAEVILGATHTDRAKFVDTLPQALEYLENVIANEDKALDIADIHQLG